MATSRENLFDPVLVTDLINKVKGKSSLAKLSGQTPIPFNGLKEFIFSMDNEIDIVAENGKKTDKTNPEGKKRRSATKSILLRNYVWKGSSFNSRANT